MVKSAKQGAIWTHPGRRHGTQKNSEQMCSWTTPQQVEQFIWRLKAENAQGTDAKEKGAAEIPDFMGEGEKNNVQQLVQMKKKKTNNKNK